MEHHKRTMASAAAMIALGAAQEAVLGALLTAADRAHRRGLVSFAVDAGASLLEHGTPAKSALLWVKSLTPTGPMRERAAARRAAGALLRVLGRLARWDTEHRMKRFFEDDYEGAQLLLARWDALGSSGFSRAERVLRELESLDASLDETPLEGLTS